MLFFFNKTRRPWSGKTAIYSYIQTMAETRGGALDGSLPDDDEFWADSSVRWVAGALDGTMGHHTSVRQQEEDVKELTQLLLKLTARPSAAARADVYVKVMNVELLGMIDALLAVVSEHPDISKDFLFQEAEWLVRHAAHRNAVKLGIALIGLFPNERLKEELLLLARHDEFTLYATTAIQHGIPDSNVLIFELAQRVTGWGKIHLVERLEPATPEIRAWLLRHGCRNDVMNEYLACICARKGELHEALAAETIDAGLYEGATDIVEALLNVGPAEDIDGYEHAPQVIAHYLRLSASMCRTVRPLNAVLDIRAFLRQPDAAWKHRWAMGWSELVRAQCDEACAAIVSRPDWDRAVLGALGRDNSSCRHYGIAAAAKLGLDIWDSLFAGLAAEPIQSSTYYELMKSDDPNRIARLVRFAEARLPLGQIAFGREAGSKFDAGPAPHDCLNAILQELDRHEGIGQALIASGLRSPVTRNRHMALKALEAWDVAAWDEAAAEALAKLAATEPEDGLRERAMRLSAARRT